MRGGSSLPPKVDLKATYSKYYEKYKGKLGSVNAQAVIQKNNEAWSWFFSLFRLKGEGKLPPYMKRVGPLGIGRMGKANGGSQSSSLGRTDTESTLSTANSSSGTSTWR